MAELPRRSMRPKIVLDLPRTLPDVEGRIKPAEFEHYTRTLAEWARDVSDQNRGGTYAPELTAIVTPPNLGAGSRTFGSWRYSNGLVFWHAFIQFGTSGTSGGSGAYLVSLPFAAITSDRTRLLFGGTAELENTGVTHHRLLRLGTSARTVIMQSTADPSVNVGPSAPFVWGVSDFMILNGWYEPVPERLSRATT